MDLWSGSATISVPDLADFLSLLSGLIVKHIEGVYEKCSRGQGDRKLDTDSARSNSRKKDTL